ncbi:hypothetical protein BDN72DRAFT_863334 [Pluteus cervinus]|uniref:Uncharacterized protein n=1 Tax=Pluteus cervinus TaxID=181527 RepID=A0ACD3A830_9AGAR|nr:hypothetical protein BDN72DRAFT_863334 [Pluteus cervinus]
MDGWDHIFRVSPSLDMVLLPVKMEVSCLGRASTWRWGGEAASPVDTSKRCPWRLVTMVSERLITTGRKDTQTGVSRRFSRELARTSDVLIGWAVSEDTEMNLYQFMASPDISHIDGRDRNVDAISEPVTTSYPDQVPEVAGACSAGNGKM